nr:MAPEG family protein [uncultured Roseateles sp.]
MTLANYCIIAAGLLPIVCAGIAKSKGFGKRRREGGFDNNNPRAWLANLSGWQARANAAQANSFEALPLFIAGVLVAQQMQAPQGRVDALALAFVASRLVFIGLYLADKASLRSLAWTVGVGCSVALFFSA